MPRQKRKITPNLPNFTQALTEAQFQALRPHMSLVFIEHSFLQQLHDGITIDSIGYCENVPQESTHEEEEDVTQGAYSVLEFVKCSQVCSAWLNKSLADIGFTCNPTGYDPIDASFHKTALLQNHVECFKMACRLMMRVLEFQKK